MCRKEEKKKGKAHNTLVLCVIKANLADLPLFIIIIFFFFLNSQHYKPRPGSDAPWEKGCKHLMCNVVEAQARDMCV